MPLSPGRKYLPALIRGMSIFSLVKVKASDFNPYCGLLG